MTHGSSRSHQIRTARFRRAALVLGVIVTLGGLLVLIGWRSLASSAVVPDGAIAAMKPNAALLFVVAGIALSWLAAHNPILVPVPQVLGTLVGLLGLATVSQDVFGWDLRIDQRLFNDGSGGTASPGRMAPLTALGFAASGAAIALSPHRVRVAQFFALLALISAAVVTVGHLYDVETLYRISTFAAMALHTAALHLMLALGVLFAKPGDGVMTVITSESLGGLMARRLLPLAFVVPIVLGWIHRLGERGGHYGIGFALSMMAVSSIIAIAAMIWWSAISLRNMQAVREHAEARLHVHLRSVLDSALDAVVSIDAADRITYWNRRSEVIFGWTSHEALGRDLATLIMPERYHDAHRRGLAHLLETGEGPILGRRIELTALRRSGEEFPIELTVTPLTELGPHAFNAFIADTTERKAADAALRVGQQQKESLLRLAKQLEQAHTFREVLAPTLEAITVVTGYRTAWAYLFSEDGSTATLLGVGGPIADFVQDSLPVLTVRGDPFLEAIFAATSPVVVDDARLDPRTNKQIVEQLQNRTIINVPLILADRRIGALGTGTFGDEGVKTPTTDQLEYFSAMSTHVAAALDRIKLLEERARVNAELERRVAARTAQLEAANKELEAFSYSVSHDLRAPLRHMDAFSRILLDEHAQHLDESAQRYLSVIRGGAQSMGRMIDDLLQLSRLDRQDADRRPTDLGSLMRDVVKEIQEDTGDRSIEWIIDTLPEVICDTGLVKLAFANLLSNAVKYTKYQDHAVIQVGADGSNPAVIFVRDNGAGFDPRYADKLFGVFQRLHRKEEFEGTGVGLATVHRVVRKHGGRIWAESEVGKGATFFLTLEGDT